MKAMLAIAPPVLLLACPAFAGDARDGLKDALANATRQEMSVAPWVSIHVTEAVRGENLVWAADTGGGQRYACTAPARADAVLTAEVSCVRLGAVSTKLAHKAPPPYDLSQRARLPFPGQADTTFNQTWPAAR